MTLGIGPPTEPQGRWELLVLRVCDEAYHLRFVKLLLQEANLGLQVESISSSREVLRHQHFDCVISDYMMPSLDGVEIARRVREMRGYNSSLALNEAREFKGGG